MSMSPTMGGERALLDAYSYMLVEASGDSESDYYDAASELGVSAGEDDAESCSCGFLSAPEIDGGGGDDFLFDCVEEDGGCGCGAAEMEDGVVDQCRGAAAAELNKSNSKGCEDSKMKLMSEMETDRLFWEACLAS